MQINQQQRALHGMLCGLMDTISKNGDNPAIIRFDDDSDAMSMILPGFRLSVTNDDGYRWYGQPFDGAFLTTYLAELAADEELDKATLEKFTRDVKLFQAMFPAVNNEALVETNVLVVGTVGNKRPSGTSYEIGFRPLGHHSDHGDWMATLYIFFPETPTKV